MLLAEVLEGRLVRVQVRRRAEFGTARGRLRLDSHAAGYRGLALVLLLAVPSVHLAMHGLPVEAQDIALVSARRRHRVRHQCRVISEG